MTWVRLDDGFPDNLKVARLSDAAFRAYVTALCYASRTLSDGAIPKERLRVVFGNTRNLNALVDACLVEVAEGGDVSIHDYLVFNPSKEKVLAERASAAERMQRSRERSGERTGEVHPPRPLPDPLLEIPTESPPPTRAKRGPLTVTDEERRKLHERYDQVWGHASVEERIAEALSHTASKKATDGYLYVNGWLRRDSERSSGNGRASNGSGTAQGGRYGSNVGQGGIRPPVARSEPAPFDLPPRPNGGAGSAPAGVPGTGAQ